MAYVHRVVVLALDGVYPFELGIPCRIFGARGPTAAALRGDHLHRRRPPGPHRRRLLDHRRARRRRRCAPPTPSSSRRSRADRRRAGELAPRAAGARPSRSCPPGTRLVSICTGAFVLAAAGPARRPAGHHPLAARRRTSSECSPQVALDPDVLFVDDGDVLTSAGAAAGIDLCLHLIRRTTAARSPTTWPACASSRPGATAARPSTSSARSRPSRPPPPRPAPGRWSAPAAAHADRPGRARPDEPAHLHPALPRRGRHEPRPVAHPAARRAGPAPAGDTDLPVDGVAGQAGFGTATSLRQHLRPPSASHRGLPADVPRRRPHAGEHTVLIDFPNARCRLPATRAPQCPGAVSLDRHEICPIKERFLGFGGIDLTGRPVRIIVVGVVIREMAVAGELRRDRAGPAQPSRPARRHTPDSIRVNTETRFC